MVETAGSINRRDRQGLIFMSVHDAGAASRLHLPVLSHLPGARVTVLVRPHGCQPDDLVEFRRDANGNRIGCGNGKGIAIYGSSGRLRNLRIRFRWGVIRSVRRHYVLSADDRILWGLVNT